MTYLPSPYTMVYPVESINLRLGSPQSCHNDRQSMGFSHASEAKASSMRRMCRTLDCQFVGRRTKPNGSPRSSSS